MSSQRLLHEEAPGRHASAVQVLKDLYRRLVQQGLRMVCIVTKVDLIDPQIEADTVNVVHSAQVHHLRQFVSNETGMPVNQVRCSTYLFSLVPCIACCGVLMVSIGVEHGGDNSNLLGIESSSSPSNVSKQTLRPLCIALVSVRASVFVSDIITHNLVGAMRTLTFAAVPQVHPVVNLVRDFDPQDNFPLGHLALFNVRCALAAARHCELSPPAPGSVPNAAGMEWDTLSFPSRITSDDGMSGRSHPVGSVAGGFPATEALNGRAKSVAGSNATDIDAELMREGSEANA